MIFHSRAIQTTLECQQHPKPSTLRRKAAYTFPSGPHKRHQYAEHDHLEYNNQLGRSVERSIALKPK